MTGTRKPRPAKPAPGTHLQAPAYTARRCPACEVWVLTALGPFAEGDQTKTLADALHWEQEHATEEERASSVLGFPFMQYNEVAVEAVYEGRR